MAINYFIANDLDLETVYQQIILWFKSRQYEVKGKEEREEYFIQARKTSFLRTVTGTNIAFKIKIYWCEPSHKAREFAIETTTGKWISNFAGAGITSIFTGGATLLTGIAGAGWTIVVEKNLIEYLENSLQSTRITSEGRDFNSDRDEWQVYSNNAVVELSPRQKAEAKVKVELEKLTRAYQTGILDSEEFETKSKALEATIERYEIDLAIEEQMEKLERAFIDGILNEREYEVKVINTARQVEEQIVRQRLKRKQIEYVNKLKKSVERGELSPAEYEAKIADLDSVQ